MYRRHMGANVNGVERDRAELEDIPSQTNVVRFKYFFAL